MIRHIIPEELPLTREVAFGFFEESKLPGELDFPYWMDRWESLMVELDIGTILVYEVNGQIKGIIGGVCVRCTMTADLEAVEAFWYVQPECRGGPAGVKLLKAFENWATGRQAVRIKMMHLSGLNADTMRDIYLRMGYSPLEHAYVKEIPS